MDKIKYCPDLTTYSERQGYSIGSGMIKEIHLNECIKEKCAAYRDGICEKYGNFVEVKEDGQISKK